MGDPLQHAKSSAEKFGGVASDYLNIHQIMDSSKMFLADWRHRAVLHNTFGMHLMETYIIGPTFKRESDGEEVCTRTVVTEHIREDLNVVPTLGEFLREMPLRRWMMRATREEVQRLKHQTIGEESQMPSISDEPEPEVRVSATVIWKKGKPPLAGTYLIDHKSAGPMPTSPTARWDGQMWSVVGGHVFGVPYDWEPEWWAEIPMDPVLDSDSELAQAED